MSEYVEIDAQELNDYISSLEDENKALKAQVEKLREAMENLMAFQVKNLDVWHNAPYDRCSKLLKATPAQCLAEIKAQAVEQYKKSDEFCKLQDRAYRAGRTAGHNDAHFEQLQQQAKEQK